MFVIINLFIDRWIYDFRREYIMDILFGYNNI